MNRHFVVILMTRMSAGVALMCWAIIGLAGCASPPENNMVQATTVMGEPDLMRRTFSYLEREMDVYHVQTIVYDDFESGGDRFVPSGWMKGPDPQWPRNQTSLKLTQSTNGTHSGSSCLRVDWNPPAQDQWVAVAWQHPEGNWGDAPGLNLRGATQLSFWARGETGKELVEFKFAAIHDEKRKYADSARTLTTEVRRLSTQWERYGIDLKAEDLKCVLCGFCFVVNKTSNPKGCVFYLDDISIDHSRLESPRLVRSYNLGLRNIPEARQLRNTCYIYDNALVISAFLSSHSDDHRRRAKLIADAFVKISSSTQEGYLQNGFACGDLLADSLTDPVSPSLRMPGCGNIDENGNVPPGQPPWMVDTYAMSVDCGNMAWAMLALLNVWEDNGRGDNSPYLFTAQRLGLWIIKNATDDTGNVGFYGGFTWDWIGKAYVRQGWKSTEHNIDLAVAFSRLAGATKDADGRNSWEDASKNARRFVQWAQEQGMTDGKRLITGSKPFSVNDLKMVPNFEPKPLDPQTWSVAAFPTETHQFESALDWGLHACRVDCGGVFGYQFSAGVGGNIWPEGTGQVALALKVLGRKDEANRVLQQLDTILARTSSPGAMPAAFPGAVDTGFGGKYYDMPHIGATAWYVLAKRGWNPYTGQGVR